MNVSKNDFSDDQFKEFIKPLDLISFKPVLLYTMSEKMTLQLEIVMLKMSDAKLKIKTLKL